MTGINFTALSDQPKANYKTRKESKRDKHKYLSKSSVSPMATGGDSILVTPRWHPNMRWKIHTCFLSEFNWTRVLRTSWAAWLSSSIRYTNRTGTVFSLPRNLASSRRALVFTNASPRIKTREHVFNTNIYLSWFTCMKLDIIFRLDTINNNKSRLSVGYLPFHTYYSCLHHLNRMRWA